MTRDWPRVSVGIVTWNSERHMPTCLDGLERQCYPRLELIVVDNASIDVSVKLVHSRAPGTRILVNERNEGYSRAQNQAIRLSSGEFYLALNPDVELSPGFIQRQIEALEERPECGSAAGKLWQTSKQPPLVLDGAGLSIDRSRHQYLRGYGQVDRGQFDQPQEVFGVDGAAAFYRRSMLEDVEVDGEYFDEQYFAHIEDVDLAWRARLQGWKCWYEPRATAFHDRAFKPGRRRTMHRDIRSIAVKNRYLTILKNEGREEWRRDWWRILGYDLGIWAYILLFEQSSLGALGMLRAQWDGELARRRKIWARVKAPPGERLHWFT